MSGRITFGAVYEPELPEEHIPPGFLQNRANSPLQQWRNDRILIFCQGQAYHDMYAHARENQRSECTGLLIGQVFRDPAQNLPFVIIDRTLRVEAESHSGVHVHVDAGRFRHARQEVEQRYPGMVLVGWYHTHPNLGVFLSSTDHQVTNGLFNASWHVAIVIDPVRGEEGAFVRQGRDRVASIIKVDEPTPIVPFMALYRNAQELRETGHNQDAQQRLQQLQQEFNKTTPTSYSADLQLWIERGGYRDLAAQLEQLSRASAIAPQRGTPTNADAPAPTALINQQLQDVLRSQDTLARQIQQLADDLRGDSVRRVHWLDIVGLFFSVAIIIALGLDIFLQQLHTQAIEQQNVLLATMIAQNGMLNARLAQPTTPLALSTAAPLPPSASPTARPTATNTRATAAPAILPSQVAATLTRTTTVSPTATNTHATAAPAILPSQVAATVPRTTTALSPQRFIRDEGVGYD